MEPSPNAFAIIKQFEGFKPTAYQDQRGIWTIGYGHTRNVVAGDTCTTAQAQTYLAEDVQGTAAAINQHVTVPLTQNQFDALTSLVFNIGAGNFEESTLLRLLNDRNYNGAADEFLQWKRAGTYRNALLPRRQEERALFLKAA